MTERWLREHEGAHTVKTHFLRPRACAEPAACHSIQQQTCGPPTRGNAEGGPSPCTNTWLERYQQLGNRNESRGASSLRT